MCQAVRQYRYFQFLLNRYLAGDLVYTIEGTARLRRRQKSSVERIVFTSGERTKIMRFLQVALLSIAAGGIALAGDVPVSAPEIGADSTTIFSALGVLAGGLLIVRARRKK